MIQAFSPNFGRISWILAALTLAGPPARAANDLPTQPAPSTQPRTPTTSSAATENLPSRTEPAGTPANEPSPAQPVKPTAPIVAHASDAANGGRIDLQVDPSVRYRLDRNGDRVQLRFDIGTKFAPLPAPPRNVAAMVANSAILELTLAHNAALNTSRSGDHITLAITDPPTAETTQARNAEPAKLPTTAPQASAGAVTQGRPASVLETAPKPAEAALTPSAIAKSPELGGRWGRPNPTASSSTMAGATPAPGSTMVARTDLPPPPDGEKMPAGEKPRADEEAMAGRPAAAATGGPFARRVRLPSDADGSAVLLPFDASVGAAAFATSDGVSIVFDRREAVSLMLLADDPVFNELRTTPLPAGTLFQMKVPENRAISLALVPQGWRLFVKTTAPNRQTIVPITVEGRLDLPADQPGAVVSVADPDTGSTLLVGTQRRPGQSIATRRRAPGFILRPTLQGVVVEALADTLQVSSNAKGFSLTSTAGPLGLSPLTPALQAAITGASLTRRLDLPKLRTETLRHHLQQQVAKAGATPPLSRGPSLREAAADLLSLGFAAEADGLLRVLIEQDPKEAASADTAALKGIAAVLANRPDDADSLADPRLNGIDEIDFWRAVRQAMADEGSPAAAAILASTGPLALSYPKPISDRLLPLVAETLLLGGETAAAGRLMDARPNDTRLAYARALRKQAEGDTDGALSDLDRMARGRDQSNSARAAVHAIELRLKNGQIKTAEAAEALEKRLLSWRGDDRELAVRERVAALRADTGAWRTALTTLREAKNDFPERAGAIDTRLETMFGEMLRDDGKSKLPPLDFVAMIDENADLMPRYENDPQVQQALLDRLLALDLPTRAMPILRKLLAGSASDVAKARYGETLAALQVLEGQGMEALATLEDTETEAAPEDLAEARILTRAEAMVSAGQRDRAIALLKQLATAAAAGKRATLEESAGHWDAAAAAWRDALASTTIPASGPVGEAASHVLTRLATATARAGDDAGLTGLREAWGNRMPQGPNGDAFRLLTAAPIRGTEDLRRSGKEVGLASAVATGKPESAKFGP